jgi:hypothetical protein
MGMIMDETIIKCTMKMLLVANLIYNFTKCLTELGDFGCRLADWAL